MSWWRREWNSILAWVAALVVGYLAWAGSQWASDAVWADFIGGIGAVLVGFILLNKSLRMIHRGRLRARTPNDR